MPRVRVAGRLCAGSDFLTFAYYFEVGGTDDTTEGIQMGPDCSVGASVSTSHHGGKKVYLYFMPACLEDDMAHFGVVGGSDFRSPAKRRLHRPSCSAHSLSPRGDVDGRFW